MQGHPTSPRLAAEPHRATRLTPAVVGKLSPDPWEAALLVESRMHLTLGTDALSKEDLKSAVESGYRSFDTGDTYVNVKTLSEVLAEAALDRSKYEILFKVEAQPGETADALEGRLRRTADLFNGLLDIALIHNVEDHVFVDLCWPVLVKLRDAKAITKIGLGNVRDADLGFLRERFTKSDRIGAVENSLDALLLSKDVRDWIAGVGHGAEVFYYSVLKTATAVGVDPASHLAAFFAVIEDGLPELTSASISVRAIMSSSNAETRKSNREVFEDTEQWPSVGDQSYGAITEVLQRWRAAQVCGQHNDAFVACPALLDWLKALLDVETLRAVRESFAAGLAESSWPTMNQPFTTQWVCTKAGVAKEDVDHASVPCRKGLKRAYIGMPLIKVLMALVGEKTCEHIWSFEILMLLVKSPQDWDEAIRAGSPTIAVPQ